MAFPGAQAPMMQQPAQQQEPEVIRNLMVNYIPTTIDEVQLRQLFEMYGPIESLKIVSDRETRQSKGYGFVKYRFGFSSTHAIQYLNGYPLMNKRLKVSYANAAEATKVLNSYQMGGPGMDQQQAYMQQMQMMQQQQQQMMMMQQQQAGAGAPAPPQQHAAAPAPPQAAPPAQ